MTKRLSLVLMVSAAAMLLLLASGCSTVPGTGRSQLRLVDQAALNQQAVAGYRQIMSQSQLSKNKTDVAMINRVGRRISAAAEEFLTENGLSAEIASYAWEFNLINDPKTVNAFCMPGGKVAFYSGILPIAKDEAGVAAIMGHEVAHAIANHGAERASQQTAVGVGGAILDVALGTKVSGATSEMIMAAYGAGSHVGILLPFSRTHEKEADRLGMLLMAKAGYDPQEAVRVWERMAERSAAAGGQGSEFFSTHPSDKTRIKELNKYLPESQAQYKPSNQKSTWVYRGK